MPAPPSLTVMDVWREDKVNDERELIVNARCKVVESAFGAEEEEEV